MTVSDVKTELRKKSRVYVVQRSLTMKDGLLVEKHDISSAAGFGELVDLLAPEARPFNPGPVLAELDAKLRDFRRSDYILCIGNPVLIGWTVAIAASRVDGDVVCLQWSNGRYREVPAKIPLETIY